MKHSLIILYFTFYLLQSVFSQVERTVIHNTTGNMIAEITAALGDATANSVTKLTVTGSAEMSLADCHAVRDSFNTTTLKTLDLSSAVFAGDMIPSESSGSTPGAFRAMKMETLLLPDNLLTIGQRAFHSCTKINNLTYPSNLEKVLLGAFTGCSALNSTLLPNTVTEIKDGYNFQNCSALALSSLPQNLAGPIGGNSFSGTSVAVSIIPVEVTAIGNQAFYNAKVTSIVLPAGIISIGNSAFQSTKVSFTSVTFYGSTPPTFGTKPFGELTNTFEVHVPTGLKNTFESAIVINLGYANATVIDDFDVETLENPLTAPTVQAGTTPTTTGFTANWIPNDTNAVGYKVEVYFGAALVKTVNVTGQATTNATVNGLVTGLSYKYNVTAKADGISHTDSWTSAFSPSVILEKAPVPSNPLKVILKLDDLGARNSSNSASAVMDWLISKQLKAGFGAIANRFDNTAITVMQPYLSAVAPDGKPLFEIWNHGYYHTSAEFNEFRGEYDWQNENFSKADTTILSKLGVQMRSFGTPYNQNDLTTWSVLENHNYKVFMYGGTVKTPSTVFSMKNIVNMEKTTAQPDFATFIESYNSRKGTFTDYIILQGHPNGGFANAECFDNFKLIVEFLLTEGVEYMNPYEYYLFQAGLTAEKNVTTEKLFFSITENGNCVFPTSCNYICLYSIDGRLLAQTSGSSIRLPKKGIFIVQASLLDGTLTRKIINR